MNVPPDRRQTRKVSSVRVDAWFNVASLSQQSTEAFETACQMADEFHRLPSPDPFHYWKMLNERPVQVPFAERGIPVVDTFNEVVYGQYFHSARTERELSDQSRDYHWGPEMELNPRAVFLEFTVLHELFHMIHFELLHHSRATSDKDEEYFGRLQRFVRTSPAYKRLESAAFKWAEVSVRLQRENSGTRDQREEARQFAAFLGYYASLDESLARYYSQVIHFHGCSKNRAPDKRTTAKAVEAHGGIFAALLFLAPSEARLFGKELGDLFRQLNWGKPRRYFWDAWKGKSGLS